MIVSTYGFDVDTSKLTDAIRARLFTTALNHVFGNEVAAQVTGAKDRHFKTWVKENPDADESAYEGYDDDEIESLKTQYRTEKFNRIMDGTLTIRQGGVSVDPIEAAMARLSKAYISGVLKGKAKWEKGAAKGDPQRVNLGGTYYTMDELVERDIAKRGEELRKAAEKEVKAKEREQAGLAKVDVAEALGL